MNRRITAILMSLILIVVLAAPTLTAMAAKPEAGAKIAIKTPSKAEIQAMNSLSLEARMSAKDLTTVKVDASMVEKSLSERMQPMEATMDRPMQISGGKAAAGADAAAKKSFPDQWSAKTMATPEMTSLMQAQADLAEPMGTNGVFTTYYGNLYTAMYNNAPWRATGKLYFQNPAGSWGVCSASVISPNDIIVTAAHCVYNTDTNQWNKTFVFVPAERNGAAPYGKYNYSQVVVLTNWQAAASYNAGIRYDVALLRLRVNGAGQRVTYYTGFLGRSINNGYTMSVTEIGYPSNLPGAAKFTWIGHAESWSAGVDIYAFGSNMGSGASGSPVMKTYAPYQTGANNYVIGVQSGSSPSATAPTYNVAARFSSYNIVPLCTPSSVISWIGC